MAMSSLTLVILELLMPRLSEVLEISKSLFLSLYSSVAIEAKKTTFIGSFLSVLLTQYLKIQVDRRNQAKPICFYSITPASSLQELTKNSLSHCLRCATASSFTLNALVFLMPLSFTVIFATQEPERFS